MLYAMLVSTVPEGLWPGVPHTERHQVSGASYGRTLDQVPTPLEG